MIVDSSALIALLQDKPLADRIVELLTTADAPAISAATLLEVSIVADGSGDPVRSARFDELIEAIGLEVVPFTEAQAAIARRAYRDYGHGSGHPARLNLGDCFTYALAKERRQPLLFVGEDFAQTDLRPALTAD